MKSYYVTYKWVDHANLANYNYYRIAIDVSFPESAKAEEKLLAMRQEIAKLRNEEIEHIEIISFITF